MNKKLIAAIAALAVVLALGLCALFFLEQAPDWDVPPQGTTEPSGTTEPTTVPGTQATTEPTETT